MMKLRINLMDFALIFVYFIFFTLSIVDDSFGKWLLIYSIGIIVRLMWLHRYNQSILIILIFASTYFLYMILYYFYDIAYSTYKNLQTLEYTNGTLRVISLFIILLFYMIRKKKKEELPLRTHLEYTYNKLAFAICAIIMAGIMLYAVRGNNIFHFTYGEDTTNSSLFEYFFMFLIIAHCNASKKSEKIIINVICVLYVAASLILGLRLVTLIVIMSIFVFYFEDRFKTKWIIVGSVAGFFLMSAVSSLRVSITTGFSQMDMLSLLGVKSDVMINNQGDVFLASTVHYGITQNGFMTSGDRFHSLLAFICNFFLPSSRQLDIGVLNRYISGTYLVGGGGFGAMYAYVWLGYIGVVFLAWFISHFINQAYEDNKTSYYGIFLVITSFRWFAYSLPIVFKMGLYLFLFYQFAKLVSLRTGEKKLN